MALDMLDEARTPLDMVQVSAVAAPMRDWTTATCSLLECARRLGWRNETTFMLVRLCCPRHDPRYQLCVGGPRFSACLVWEEDVPAVHLVDGTMTGRFAVHSVVFAGLLAFFPASPLGTGRPAIGYGAEVLDLPMTIEEFGAVVRGERGRPAAPSDMHDPLLAAFVALHCTFAVPVS